MRGFRGVYYALALVLALWTLFPIYLLGVLAFSERPGVFAYPKPLYPDPLSLETLAAFWQVPGVAKALMNSLAVALITLLLALALGAPAGYALARYRFVGADLFRLLVLSTRAFPLPILAIPLAVRFIQLGLYDTPLGVALVHTALALPFAVLVSAGIFLAIPKELEEAAWTLGCTRIQAFWKVVLPLAVPGLMATGIFAFIISWNEVFAATLLTLRERTLTALLLTLLHESPLPFRFAGGFILVVPALLFIFAVRRYLFTLFGLGGR